MTRATMRDLFQLRVGAWVYECFGTDAAEDSLEHADRFIEEALELSQTVPDFTADRAHALVDYVFSRPVGGADQEVGGVMVTLAALCNALGIDMYCAGSSEVRRVWVEIEKIREKQASKPVGSALPIAGAMND